MPTTRSILHIHLHGLSAADHELYEHALTVLRDITPIIQALAPDGAALDITGALRFFDRDTTSLSALIHLRLAAHCGLTATVGAGPNPAIAAMAAAAPGQTTTVGPGAEAVTAFLDPLPIGALQGVGPAITRALAPYGIHRVADLHMVPLLTLQRILGKAAARTLTDRASGHDPRPVTPAAAPKSTGASCDFGHGELDPTVRRRALLDLTERLGLRLRTTRQVAARLTLTVSYADGTSTSRSRTLDEPTAHSPALSTSAYELYE